MYIVGHFIMRISKIIIYQGEILRQPELIPYLLGSYEIGEV